MHSRANGSSPTWTLLFCFLILNLFFIPTLSAQEFRYTDSWGDQGFTTLEANSSRVVLSFSLTQWNLMDVDIDGELLKTVMVPGMILPNDEGAPNLPGVGGYLALPNQATASLQITGSRTVVLTDVDLAPAPRIPFETEDGPLSYQRDMAIYGQDALYPVNSAILSAVTEIRGVDAVLVGVTPFQYNPVKRELVVYRDLTVEITIDGGDGQVGEQRLRSPWWDPILQDIFLNAEVLPPVEYSQRGNSRTDDFEYLIICPDDPDFQAWADSIRVFRTEQGIRTGVKTVTEVGGNTVAAIESYVNDAYNNWDIPPAAILLLGDYSTGSDGIISPIWDSYCASDNIYADVNNNNMPDIIFARITAQNADQLQNLVGKGLGYERQPPTSPSFYQNPVLAGGWQTERWFILCQEILAGFMTNILGKTPIREYAIYSGSPGTTWSTAQNTNAVLNYFGPNGLGYIPSTPSYLNDWGANAARLNADINAGTFIVQHRDHGSTNGWGEPYYVTSHLSGLSNPELTFVFSINCLTGKYNMAGPCFAEAFHHHDNGALGLIAASETSYSFVNDAYVWGMFDYFWPNFDPGYGASGDHNLWPAFGNASGKYYLQASNWPYNTNNKTVTYHLFHHHGDAFMTVYSEVPQPLLVSHDNQLISGVDEFTVTADAGSMIGLVVDGQYVGSAMGTGSPVAIPITPQLPGSNLVVTVTKQNHNRYRQEIPILPPAGPYLIFEAATVLDTSGDDDGELDEGETAELAITLENLGVEEALGITGTLTTDDPHVAVLQAEFTFPNIPAGGFGTCLTPGTVQVVGDIADGHVVQFTLYATATNGAWDPDFALGVQAPVLTAGGFSVDDGLYGNADGGANAGETVFLAIPLRNLGHSDTDDLTCTLESLDPHAIVLGGPIRGDLVPVGEEVMVGNFQVEILESCPEPSNLAFTLSVSARNGYNAVLNPELSVGGWFDDLEQDRGWFVGQPDDNASLGLWERVDPIEVNYNGNIIQPEDDHTEDPGVLCFITGQHVVGQTAGYNDVDGGKTTLLTPVFDLEGAVSAMVSYYRWYSNSWGNNPDQDWWDVEVTSDGVNWVSLEHTQQTENMWVLKSFELTDYITLTDQVQMRFVAADEDDASLVEAGVDDFLLTIVRPLTTGVGEEETSLPVRLALGENYPNPFNPKTTIHFDLPKETEVELAVYDMTGRRVATLVSDQLPAGHHQLSWLGKDQSGRQVASGVYISRLVADGEVVTKKMMLMK